MTSSSNTTNNHLLYSLFDGGAPPEPIGGITLSAIGRTVKGVPYADLSWVGSTSAEVDVYRNGGSVTTIANDGFYTDQPAKRGGGSFTYKVCEAGTSVCSNEVTVVI